MMGGQVCWLWQVPGRPAVHLAGRCQLYVWVAASLQGWPHASAAGQRVGLQ
jgi:hypothetical protein